MGTQPEYNVLLVEDDIGHAALINRAFETESRCQLVTTATLQHEKFLINHTSPD